MNRLKLIFAASGEFALPTLRALTEHHDVVQIFTQPDRRAGRGRKFTPTPVGQFAIEQDLPLARTSDINAEKLPDADLLVVIAFGQKIADHVIHHARLGAVNLHGSRLPKFRGAAPVNAAILAGERTSGNSIIRLAQKMDAGAVLGMSEIPIGELETAGELHDRLALDGAPLMLRVLDELATGRAIEVEQDHSQATLARKMNRDTAKIDWTKPAEHVARQIRGLYPWPGCHVRLLSDGKELTRATLARARAVPLTSTAPGTIDANGHIGTSDGAIEVVELKPDGKRAMTLAEFKNGHSWTVGMKVESL